LALTLVSTIDLPLGAELANPPSRCTGDPNGEAVLAAANPLPLLIEAPNSEVARASGVDGVVTDEAADGETLGWPNENAPAAGLTRIPKTFVGVAAAAGVLAGVLAERNPGEV